MSPHLVDFVFSSDDLRRLHELVEVDHSAAVTSVNEIPESLRSRVELLIAGWGMSELSEEDIDRLPALRAVVHWAGGGGFLPSGASKRSIVLATGRSVNAVPVAEWTVSMIVLAAKDAFWASRRYCAEQGFIDRESELSGAGLYRTTVGIVGASSIGTLVMEMLKRYDVEVLLHDPYAGSQLAVALGAELVDDLTELARRSQLLSLHPPVTSETVGMVSRCVLADLPDGATLINTARGAIVDQEALVEELQSGRIRAVLDVTEPEVLPAGHPLYSLPNVFLTPHLAGSLSVELRRLGEAALHEVENYAAGRPFCRPMIP